MKVNLKNIFFLFSLLLLTACGGTSRYTGDPDEEAGEEILEAVAFLRDIGVDSEYTTDAIRLDTRTLVIPNEDDYHRQIYDVPSGLRFIRGLEELIIEDDDETMDLRYIYQIRLHGRARFVLRGNIAWEHLDYQSFSIPVTARVVEMPHLGFEGTAVFRSARNAEIISIPGSNIRGLYDFYNVPVEELYIARSHIDGNDLYDFPYYAPLRVIDLCGTPVETLAGLAYARYLETIYLGDNVNLLSDDIYDFQDQRPDVDIIYGECHYGILENR